MKFRGNPRRVVSARMRRVKSRDTGLERAMEQILRSMNLRYEKQPRLPGHPDFKVLDAKVVLFCDSSFWHGRRQRDLNGESFKVRREFWADKLRYNKERDKKVTRKLRGEGWNVIRFWDNTILRRPDVVKARIERALNEVQ